MLATLASARDKHMSLLRFLPLILLTGLTAPAYAGIYKCTDADGRITYTNDRALGRNCMRLQSDPPVSSIPAPARAAAAESATGAPVTFPRVSPNDQRNRDDARRQVLESELATEERALADAEQALAERGATRPGDERKDPQVPDPLQPIKDKAELHKRNIEALRREISGLR